MKVPDFTGKMAVAKTNTKAKAKTPTHTNYNLYLVKAKYNKKDNDWYCEVDNKVYPLVWDASQNRFTNLYSLPSNDKHTAWTCVQFDIKQYDEEKLTKILQYWSPVKQDDNVYVVIHEGNAIITSKKK